MDESKNEKVSRDAMSFGEARKTAARLHNFVKQLAEAEAVLAVAAQAKSNELQRKAAVDRTEAQLRENAAKLVEAKHEQEEWLANAEAKRGEIQAELEDKVRSRGVRIADLDAVIASKEEHIAGLDAEYQEKRAALEASHAEAVERLGDQIQLKQATLTDLENMVEALRSKVLPLVEPGGETKGEKADGTS